jgi:hypothetical protein
VCSYFEALSTNSSGDHICDRKAIGVSGNVQDRALTAAAAKAPDGRVSTPFARMLPRVMGAGVLGA